MIRSGDRQQRQHEHGTVETNYPKKSIPKSNYDHLNQLLASIPIVDLHIYRANNQKKAYGLNAYVEIIFFSTPTPASIAR